MEVAFQSKNLLKKEEVQFSKYFEEKLEAIANLLTKFPADAQMLKVSVEKFDKHDAYQVELTLILPTKNIKSKEVSHTLTKATDLSKDRMIAQIKKHMAHLRKDRGHKSIREGMSVAEKKATEALIEI